MRNHDWQQEYDQFRDEILRLKQENARLRAVVEVAKQLDSTTRSRVALHDALAALEVSDE